MKVTNFSVSQGDVWQAVFLVYAGQEAEPGAVTRLFKAKRQHSKKKKNPNQTKSLFSKTIHHRR
jgi:hypothetical protein